MNESLTCFINFSDFWWLLRVTTSCWKLTAKPNWIRGICCESAKISASSLWDIRFQNTPETRSIHRSGADFKVRRKRSNEPTDGPTDGLSILFSCVPATKTKKKDKTVKLEEREKKRKEKRRRKKNRGRNKKEEQRKKEEKKKK